MCRAVPAGTCGYRSCGCWLSRRGAIGCEKPRSHELAKQLLASLLVESHYWAKWDVALTQHGISHVLLFPGRLVGAHQQPSNSPICWGCCYFSLFSLSLPKNEIVEIPSPFNNKTKKRKKSSFCRIMRGGWRGVGGGMWWDKKKKNNEKRC